jgi:hypothetical protein
VWSIFFVNKICGIESIKYVRNRGFCVLAVHKFSRHQDQPGLDVTGLPRTLAFDDALYSPVSSKYTHRYSTA